MAVAPLRYQPVSLEDPENFEISTYRLRAGCSASELGVHISLEDQCGIEPPAAGLGLA